MVLNWTPHEVRICRLDLAPTPLAVFPPAGFTPRLAETRTVIGSLKNVPITRVTRDQLAAPLPLLAADVVAVIVSEIAADAVRAALVAAGRGDVAVLCPDTGPGYAVRRAPDGTICARSDAVGQIVGVLALRQVLP